MRQLVYLVMVITFFLICTSGTSYCYASGSELEMDWDYLKPWHMKNRYIDTVSLHMLENISETNSRSIYRGITITRPYGYIKDHKESSAFGIGPVYMIRNNIHSFGKLSAALDMSGGIILYDQEFPVGGRFYNFMWRIGPRLTYKISESSSVNVGYMLMHVSNGLKNHNPSYEAHGFSMGFVKKY